MSRTDVEDGLVSASGGRPGLHAVLACSALMQAGPGVPLFHHNISSPPDTCCTSDACILLLYCCRRWGWVAARVVPHVRADCLRQLRSGLAVYTTRVGRLQVWGGTGDVGKCDTYVGWCWWQVPASGVVLVAGPCIRRGVGGRSLHQVPAAGVTCAWGTGL